MCTKVIHSAIAHHQQTDAQAAAVPSPWPTTLQFNCSAWHYMSWSIPLVSLGQLSWLCTPQLQGCACLPAICASPASSLTGQYEKLKRLWLHVSTAEQHLKQQCVSNIIFLLNPKHSSIPASVKKINPMSAKTKTIRLTRKTEKNKVNMDDMWPAKYEGLYSWWNPE